MDRLLASLIVAILLSGCQQFMPLTNDELAGQQHRLNQGTLVGGFCRYDNGEVVAIPRGESTPCN